MCESPAVRHFFFFLFYGRAALIFSEKHLISFGLFCNACILPLALERLFMFHKHIVVMLPCCKKSNASPWWIPFQRISGAVSNVLVWQEWWRRSSLSCSITIHKASWARQRFPACPAVLAPYPFQHLFKWPPIKHYNGKHISAHIIII